MKAQPSGIRLDNEDAAIVKGMLARGDRQHDIAAHFGVNGGRISEIATGKKFSDVTPAQSHALPSAKSGTGRAKASSLATTNRSQPRLL